MEIIITVNPCDKALGHASNSLNLSPATALGDGNLNGPSIFAT